MDVKHINCTGPFYFWAVFCRKLVVSRHTECVYATNVLCHCTIKLILVVHSHDVYCLRTLHRHVRPSYPHMQLPWRPGSVIPNFFSHRANAPVILALHLRQFHTTINSLNFIADHVRLLSWVNFSVECTKLCLVTILCSDPLSQFIELSGFQSDLIQTDGNWKASDASEANKNLS